MNHMSAWFESSESSYWCQTADLQDRKTQIIISCFCKDWCKLLAACTGSGVMGDWPDWQKGKDETHIPLSSQQETAAFTLQETEAVAHSGAANEQLASTLNQSSPTSCPVSIVQSAGSTVVWRWGGYLSSRFLCSSAHLHDHKSVRR